MLTSAHCALCVRFPSIDPGVVPGLYPAATSELTVYPSHNKAHSAEDILIRSAKASGFHLTWRMGLERKEGRKEEVWNRGGQGNKMQSDPSIKVNKQRQLGGFILPKQPNSDFIVSSKCLPQLPSSSSGFQLQLNFYSCQKHLSNPGSFQASLEIPKDLQVNLSWPVQKKNRGQTGPRLHKKQL